MTLAACRECGQQVSTEAPSCTHCGTPDPARQPSTDRPHDPPLESIGRTRRSGLAEPHAPIDGTDHYRGLATGAALVDRWRLMHFDAKFTLILLGFLGVSLANSVPAIGLPLIAIALGVAYFSGRASERRRAELAGVAHELGWRFDPSFKSGRGPPYSYFSAFSMGDFNVKAYNTIEGPLEIGDRVFPVTAGDFTTTVIRKSSSRYRFSYLLLQVPFRQLPDLVIRPEGLVDRIGAAIGFEDIDFESAEFSRRFHVSGSDKRFAYDVIHARMMEFLLARRPPQINLSRGYFCIVEPYWSMRHGQQLKPWTPAAIGSRLELAQRFFDLWPEHLISEYS